jgi:hypothetical protein
LKQSSTAEHLVMKVNLQAEKLNSEHLPESIAKQSEINENLIKQLDELNQSNTEYIENIASLEEALSKERSDKGNLATKHEKDIDVLNLKIKQLVDQLTSVSVNSSDETFIADKNKNMTLEKQ